MLNSGLEYWVAEVQPLFDAPTTCTPPREMIATNIWFWIGFVAFILAMLALDLGVFHRTVHEVRPKEAAIWTGGCVGVSLLFAAGLAHYYGRHAALTSVPRAVIE